MALALPIDPNLKTHVDALNAYFAPIFEEWRHTYPSPGSSALPATAEACLHQDFSLLAKALGEADKHTYRLNMNLLAEVLTMLRKGLNSYDYGVAMMDNEILASGATGPVAVNAADKLPDLTCVRVINEWVKQSANRRENGRAAVNALMKLVNDFIMRDGTVSNAELSLLTALEKRFAV